MEISTMAAVLIFNITFNAKQSTTQGIYNERSQIFSLTWHITPGKLHIGLLIFEYFNELNNSS
jgi:hypothetical protein